MYSGYTETDEKVAARVARRQAIHEEIMKQKEQEGEQPSSAFMGAE